MADVEPSTEPLPASRGSTANRKALLLLNAHSRQGAECLELAPRQLRELGLDLIVECNAHARDWSSVVRRYGEQVDLVIVGGGDGSLNAAVDGLVDTGLPLGVLPLGTANDLARTLGLPTDLTEACQVIADGYAKRIDLGWVNGKHFFNAASLGLSVQICKQLTHEHKSRWGVFAYGMTACNVLWNARPFHAEIRVEGDRFRVKSVQIVVGNGVYFGGGMIVAADATIDDCRLDLYSLEVQHWWQVIPLLPALRQGRFAYQSRIRTVQAQVIEIHTRRPRPINTDGEITTRTPAQFRVLPAALEVFVPPPAESEPPEEPGETREME